VGLGENLIIYLEQAFLSLIFYWVSESLGFLCTPTQSITTNRSAGPHETMEKERESMNRCCALTRINPARHGMPMLKKTIKRVGDERENLVSERVGKSEGGDHQTTGKRSKTIRRTMPFIMTLESFLTCRLHIVQTMLV
jgi:hypothetical protein